MHVCNTCGKEYSIYHKKFDCVNSHQVCTHSWDYKFMEVGLLLRICVICTQRDSKPFKKIPQEILKTLW